MKPLGDLHSAELTVLGDARALLTTIRECATCNPDTVASAIRTLAAIRAEAYEDLNQLQHEYLILKGASWLVEKKIVPATVCWFWNPRQTGGSTEPDLAAESGGVRLISAEFTASAEPNGRIDSRMAETLEKLSAMSGAKYYFVGSEPMRQRAETKVGKGGWPIHVVLISASGAP